MVNNKTGLIPRLRNQFTSLPHEFSDEEMVQDWTLTEADKLELSKYRKNFRTFIAIQLCAIRLYGRFINEVNSISIRIINYLNNQLELPPSLMVISPERDATFSEQRKNILEYLGFTKYDEQVQNHLKSWLEKLALQGNLPNELFQKAEHYLLTANVVLPGQSVLERLIISICAAVHERLFEAFFKNLSETLKSNIDTLLVVKAGDQHSPFQLLKEYPPSASISSIQSYLHRYQLLTSVDIDSIKIQLEPSFVSYVYKLTMRYNARDLKRFNEQKRYSMMVCFLFEIRKILLDYLVKMHDQFIQEMLRESKHIHEKKHRELRKRQKSAIDTVLDITNMILEWPDDKPMLKTDILQHAGESRFLTSINDLYVFKQLEERGYGDILLNRYPSLRKYFPGFINLPFAAKHGSEKLMEAINLVRQLDTGKLKHLPDSAPTSFIPRELIRSYKTKEGKLNRNAWELGLAITMKDALRSGDLYLPKSKQHVSFWELILNKHTWQDTRETAYQDLQQPYADKVKTTIIEHFNQTIAEAKKRFPADNFAEIKNGNLKLKKDDKAEIPEKVNQLQKLIDASMPSIRIEQLLMEVDQQTNFSRHFIPVQNHNARPKNFYKTLMAGLISQATNLGIVAMSSSIQGISVDMLRHVFQFYVREETIQAASAEIVNQHHQLPLSEVYGTGNLSSSDGYW